MTDNNWPMLRKFNFIAINIFSSGVLFARSVLFLKFLPEKDLGLIMLFQAIVAILGLMQIGLFSGGMRIFSVEADAHLYKSANNSNITYSIIITLLLIFFAITANMFFRFDLLAFVVASLCGGFALLQNWFSTLLIAQRKLREVNILNFSSSILSAFLALSIFIWGAIGAIVSISSMYVIYVVIFLIWQKEYFPDKLKLDFKAIKTMLYYGVIPYLSGVAFLLNNQIDRFFITKIISLEALGQFYLPVTFMTVFNLFPNNLNSLFGPKAINTYSNKKLKETISTAKIYFFILLTYSLLTVLLIMFYGETAVSMIFPDKIDQLNYLFIMLPGIIAVTLSTPFSLLLYVSLNLRGILLSNFFSLLSYLSILLLLITFNHFTIENVAYGKTIQGLLVLVFIILTTIYSWNKITNYALLGSKTRN